MTYAWSEDELSLLAWQWAGQTMLNCPPEKWQEWVDYAKANIDPSKTTDSKMGKRFTEFVEPKQDT
jgi:hypothetical protein